MSEKVKGSLIVLFKNPITEEEAKTVLENTGVTLVNFLDKLKTAIVSCPEDQDDVCIEKIKSLDNVSYIRNNQTIKLPKLPK